MDRLSALLEVHPPVAHQVNVNMMNSGDMHEHSAHSHCAFIYLQSTGCSDIRITCPEHLALMSEQEDDQIQLKSGDLLWLPHGSQHQVTAQTSGQLTLILLAFGDHQQNILLNNLPCLIHIPGGQHESSDIDPLVQLMSCEAEQQRCAHNTVLNRFSEILLVKMLRYLIANHVIESGVLGGLADNRLVKVLCAVHQNPAINWNLERMASTAGMSRTAFSLHFKQTIDMTPADYLTHWRMRIACSKLRQNKLPIARIAEQLGYQSETAFRRAFRKTQGLPPGEYKKQSRPDVV